MLVYVANGVGKNLILGQPWLRNNGACLDFATNTMLLDGQFTVNVTQENAFIGQGSLVC